MSPLAPIGSGFSNTLKPKAATDTTEKGFRLGVDLTYNPTIPGDGPLYSFKGFGKSGGPGPVIGRASAKAMGVKIIAHESATRYFELAFFPFKETVGGPF